MRSENEAKRVLADKNCDHLWGMVVNYNPERA